MNFHPPIHLSIHVMCGACVSRLLVAVPTACTTHWHVLRCAFDEIRFKWKAAEESSAEMVPSTEGLAQALDWTRVAVEKVTGSHRQKKLLDLPKQHLRKEKLKIEHHQRMRKVQRFLFGLGGGPFGSVGCLVNFTQDRFGTPWQSIVHGAKHSMPSAYDQKHKETSVDVTL
jgi:hypothetical protein